MIPVKMIDPEDLPLYAMQLLPAEEMGEMTEHLHYSPEGRRVLGEIYADLSIFAQSAEMVEVPEQVRQDFLKAVASEKRTVPVHPLDRPLDRPAQRLETVKEAAYEPRAAAPLFYEEEPAPKSFGQRVLPWTGWLLAAGLAAFSFVQVQQADELRTSMAQVRAHDLKTQISAVAANALLETMHDPSAVHATLVGSDLNPIPSGRVTYAPSRGSLLFVASNLEPLDPAKTYELWVIPTNGESIPAGTFRPDAHGFASVVMPDLPKDVEAKAFGVTIENAEGSTTPTAPIILEGQAS
jgi:hypothetical protein